MLNDKLKTVTSVARANKLSLNKNFNDGYLSAHSMYDGPQELADRIVGGMYELCRYGVNNGFGDVESTLCDLSDIVVELSKLGDGQVGKLAKHSDKASRLLSKNYTGKKNVADVAEPVRACADACIEAADAIVELRTSGKSFSNISEQQFHLLEESRAAIQKVVAALDGVIDTSSVTADENAQKIVEIMQKWRESCVNQMLTASSVKDLLSALDIVEKWKQLVTFVGRKRVKTASAFDDNDDLANIAIGARAIETYETFLARVESEKAETQKLKDKIRQREAARESEKASLRAKIDELEQQKIDIGNEIKNGADINICNRRFKEVKAKIDELDRELAKLADEPDNVGYLKDLLEVRDSVYREMYNVALLLDIVKDDPAYLAEIIADADFNSFVQLMTAKNSPDDMNKALVQIRRIKSYMDIKVDDWQKMLAKFKLNAQAMKKLDPNVVTDREELRNRGRQLRSAGDEIDPELLAIIDSGKKDKTAEKAETLGERKNVVFTDDDR